MSELTKPSSLEVFSFGDPIQLDKESDVTQFFESYYNGTFYELPFDMRGLSKLHSSALYLKSQLSVKRNILTSCFIPHKLLSATTFSRLVTDYLWTGNSYIERIDNRIGSPIRLDSRLSRFTRRGKNGHFYRVEAQSGFDLVPGQATLLPEGKILHLCEPDMNQEVYGIPDWLPAVCSAALNTESGKFRLRYYRNGSHAGYVMYLTDAEVDDDDVDRIADLLKQSKGPGNFRNLLIHAPGGKKDGLQIMPISEITAKDEFLNIKNVTRDDQFAAVRVPAVLMGVMPSNVGGFGSPEVAARVFARNELEPIQPVFTQINDWIGEEVVRFKPYEIPQASKSE